MTEEKAKQIFGVQKRIYNLTDSISKINCLLNSGKQGMTVEVTCGNMKYWTMNDTEVIEFLQKELEMKTKYLNEAKAELSLL